MASYRKNVRLHVVPNIGSVPLASLTAVRLDQLYRELEKDGRADHRAGEGLSARTVRYMHTIISAALVDAGLIPANPANPASKGAPADREAGPVTRNAPVGRQATGRVPGLGSGAQRASRRLAHVGLYRYAAR